MNTIVNVLRMLTVIASEAVAAICWASNVTLDNRKPAELAS